MFKILIKSIIDILDIVLSELKRAYEETYELSDLSKEFRDRVNEIRNNNKKHFIKAAEGIEFQKSMFTFEFAPIDQIKKRALERWKEARRKGDLDELYNIKERNYDD